MKVLIWEGRFWQAFTERKRWKAMRRALPRRALDTLLLLPNQRPGLTRGR